MKSAAAAKKGKRCKKPSNRAVVRDEEEDGEDELENKEDPIEISDDEVKVVDDVGPGCVDAACLFIRMLDEFA